MLTSSRKIKNIAFILVFLSLTTGFAGCLEDVYPSKSWSEDQKDAYVNEMFNASASNFMGSGKAMEFHYFAIYDLISDPVLAEERYLGHEMGVKVTIAYNGSLDLLDNTLWGHEIDATKIVKALYSGESGDKIGFVAVSFKYSNYPEERVVFILDARDAENFKTIWKENGYIRFIDWSKAIILDPEGIPPYEDPYNVLIPSQMLVPDTAETPSIPYSTDVFRDLVRSTTEEYQSLLYSMKAAGQSNDYQLMKLESENLLGSITKTSELFRNLPLPYDSEQLRGQYLHAMDEIWTAGSCYWYGATLIESSKIKDGNTHLEKGLTEVNQVLESLNLERVEQIQITESVLANALALNERYVYKDPDEINDISLKITNYGFKDSYVLMNGENTIIRSGYGKKFLWVTVEVTHMGYYGGGTPSIITPDPTAFTLFYKGDRYSDCTPVGKVMNMGVMYKQVELNRLETYEAVLFFIVPSELEPERTYIQANVWNAGSPIWRLA